MKNSRSLLSMIGPGVLVAATGVGAGDLATGAIVGSMYGMAVLWAVIVGALLKFTLNEGLARWQLATGKTILEGCFQHFGVIFGWLFLIYLLIWTFMTAALLMSACGVVTHAIFPVFGTAVQDKIFWGIVHSLTAIVLVYFGGYRFFERTMAFCIGLMFMTVVLTALISRPDLGEFLRGSLWPVIPDWQGGGLEWTIALLGGVGGTLTIVCYGYWIREEGRHSIEDLGVCRIDLASGYLMTALFGMAMVVLGSQTEIPEGSSASTVVLLANQLQEILGGWGGYARWLFLLGAWGAVASSLLGVWQSVPYLFADVYESLQAHYQDRKPQPVTTTGRPYQVYLLLMGLVPMCALLYDFKYVLKIAAVCGALVIPLLTIIVLTLGSQQKLIGHDHRNPAWSTILLAAGMLLFVYAAAMSIFNQFQ